MNEPEIEMCKTLHLPMWTVNSCKSDGVLTIIPETAWRGNIGDRFSELHLEITLEGGNL